ncbi:MAG: hypothetical protein M1830_005209 [Pleopsidium flavum]|nr:MAG: hypothetical protein M1830_005209 [Pleopsidium flavum]
MATADPWTLGIGVFDMKNLAWKDSYDARAVVYESPDKVKQYYLKYTIGLLTPFFLQNTPSSWSSPEVQQIFTNTTTARGPVSNPQVASNLSRGTTAGIVIGPIVGLAVLTATGAWCCVHHRKVEKPPPSPFIEPHRELEDISRRLVWELPAKERPIEVSGEMRVGIELPGSHVFPQKPDL